MRERQGGTDSANRWSADSMSGATIHDDAVYQGGDLVEEPVDQRIDSGVAFPDFATWSVGEAALRGGDIVVSATDSGLPLALRVRPDQLRRDPTELGDDILRLCRQAAGRAGLLRREYLSGIGVPDSALDLLALPSRLQVEADELAGESEHGYEPRSWLDREGDSW